MSWSFIGEAHKTGQLLGAWTWTLPAGIQDGDLMLAFHNRTSDTNLGPWKSTLTGTYGWTSGDDLALSGAPVLFTERVYKIASSEPATYSMSDGTIVNTAQWQCAMVVFRWSGGAVVDASDMATWNSTSTTSDSATPGSRTIPPATVNPSLTDSLGVHYAAYHHDGTADPASITLGSGVTSVWEQDFTDARLGLAIGYEQGALFASKTHTYDWPETYTAHIGAGFLSFEHAPPPESGSTRHIDLRLLRVDPEDLPHVLHTRMMGRE